MSKYNGLSEKMLLAFEAKRGEAWEASLDIAIAMGFGDWRHSDMVALAKQGNSFAIDHCAAWNAYSDVLEEMHARKTYHGSLKPIKRIA